MDWEAQRRRMVEVQLRRRNIRDERVLAAMLEIPREEFVPEAYRRAAYEDDAVVIGHGQTISQPYIVALMAQCLELKGTEIVLEVGGGSGYHAAVLGALAARVISIELIPELAALARENLERTGRTGNIAVICGDGSIGYPDAAPYDAISAAAAAPEIPASLVDQLRDPGRLVIPVGGREDQELRLVKREGGTTGSSIVALVRFVPLRGGEGWR
jgi:protein-L-isoaspartate(D-aspartate) O-methyltransferase